MTNQPYFPRQSRTHWSSECEFCVENRNKRMPPHEASARCESGKQNHCSCDRCF